MNVVLVTLAATFFIQAGYFLWKIAADRLPPLGKTSLKKTLRAFLSSPPWLLGTAATTIGWMLFLKASDLGDIGIVQPLMSVGDMFLVAAAVIFLGEKLRGREWWGAGLSVAGAVLLGAEARTSVPSEIAWVRLSVLILGIVLFWLLLYLRGRRGGASEAWLACGVGAAFGLGALLTEVMTAHLHFSGKALESFAGVFNPVLPTVVIANVIGLVLLQAAFQRGRAAVVVPIQLALANGLVLLGGALLFAEPLTPQRLSGAAAIVVGTGLLCRLKEAEPTENSSPK